MATLTLENVPEALLDRLRDEATKNRRSLNQEALARLEASLAARWQTPDEKVELIRRLHARNANVTSLDDQFLRAAKRKGRS